MINLFDDNLFGVNSLDRWEQKCEEERKALQEIKEKVEKADWQKFFDMQAEDIAKISFPIKIKSDNYASLSQDELDMINDCYNNNATYLEQELARRESCDGNADEEGSNLRYKYFEEHKGTYTFTFRAFYWEIYKALKGVDADLKTNFATLFIESVISYGLGGGVVSNHNIINAAMAGVKFYIDRDLENKRKFLELNEKRRMSNEGCKASLEDLFHTDKDVSYEARKALRK